VRIAFRVVSETERRIVAALQPGWRLVSINWKKRGKIKVVNGFGNSLRDIATG
jgi:hypothetical protein